MSRWQFDTPLLLLKLVMPVEHGLSQHYIIGGCRTSSMNYVKNSIPFLGMWKLHPQGFTEKLALVPSKFARASMGINGKSRTSLHCQKVREILDMDELTWIPCQENWLQQQTNVHAHGNLLSKTAQKHSIRAAAAAQGIWHFHWTLHH